MDGYALSNIDWSPRVGETKVTVSKDGQFATLSFNQALLSQSIARNAGMPANLNPAANLGGLATPDMPVNRIRPAPIPMLPTPPPRVRGIIPRKPLGGYQPMQNPSTLQPAAQPVEVPIEKQQEQ
jgi:hypothetical protein